MEIIDRVLQSSVQAPPRTVDSVFKILVEEVGELSRSLNRPHRCTEPPIAEIADVLNSAIDLVYMIEVEALDRQGINKGAINLAMLKRQIEFYVDHKCNKWDGLKETYQ